MKSMNYVSKPLCFADAGALTLNALVYGKASIITTDGVVDVMPAAFADVNVLRGWTDYNIARETHDRWDIEVSSSAVASVIGRTLVSRSG